MRNAETLFLVDYSQSEVSEFDRFLQYLVSADEEVYLALLELFDYFSLLLRGAVAREQFNVNRKMLETAQRGLVVLPRENCRRSEYRTLLA